MRLDKTNWPPDWGDIPGTSATVDFGSNPVQVVDRVYQPAFGVEVLWNIPREWWKPVLIVYFWRWRLQIGWLVD
jgi:hypothetical protein